MCAFKTSIYRYQQKPNFKIVFITVSATTICNCNSSTGDRTVHSANFATAVNFGRFQYYLVIFFHGQKSNNNKSDRSPFVCFSYPVRLLYVHIIFKKMAEQQ